MTDTPPITVNANPAKPTLEAFVRQCITVAGLIAGGFGLTKTAGMFSTLLLFAGPISSLIAMGWGLWATYSHAASAAKMANALPATVAVTK